MAGTEEGGPALWPAHTPSADPILDAKLQRPPSRPEWVERARLMKELDHAVLRPVVLVPAPAGFGKTTLVTQWLASDRAPQLSAWVSLDSRDNDPVQLWTHVAMALDRVGCRLDTDVASFMATYGGEVMAGLLPQLVHAMGQTEDDLVLLLDDFHVLQDPVCHRQMEFLVEHLPPGTHLVLVTRADPGLRLGRLRATGQVAEIRAAELAFTADEAASMLAAEDVQLTEGSVRELVQRTEGWPAGLYLAALSMAGRPDPDEFIREVSGSNRFIGDYLTEEVLASQREEVRAFIMTTSILERLTAPLCNYLTGTTGSVAVLRELERSNLFLVPLDEGRTWFRFHHLFASVARNELELEQPEIVPELHAKAATWFREHGFVDEAVAHSLASGRTIDAAQLVQASWLDYVDAGRTATVQAWLDALGADSVAADPVARVTAAWLAALTGDVATLDEHLAALAPYEQRGPLPDGCHSVKSAVAMIRGIFGYGGPAEMQAQAQLALELETDGRSPFYSIAYVAAGHAAYVSGDLDLSLGLSEKAALNEAAPGVIRLLALSVMSLAHGERGDHEQSLRLAEQAMSLVEARGLQAMLQASFAHSALGLAQAAAGDVATALATIEQGLSLRRKNPAQGPWGNLHQFLAAARVAVEAGDLVMAQHLVEEASTHMDRFGAGMEAMRERLHLVETDIRAVHHDALVREALTERELEVLQLLHSSLSLNEIAGQLYISGNTVKTHTKAVYRKLGASSRTEALRIARDRMLV